MKTLEGDSAAGLLLAQQIADVVGNADTENTLTDIFALLTVIGALVKAGEEKADRFGAKEKFRSEMRSLLVNRIDLLMQLDVSNFEEIH